MPKKQKLYLKIGDRVTVISGFYKNESGEITRINCKTGKIIIKGIKAIRTDFLTTSLVERFNSNSREPSKTIKIKPMVPKIGSTTLRLGTMISYDPPT